EEVDADAMIGPPHPVDARTAVLRVRPGRGTSLRLRARNLAEDGENAENTENAPDGVPEGWDVVRMPVGDLWALAEQVASHGPDVVAVEPEDLREAVVRLLSGAASIPVRSGGDGEAPAGRDGGAAHVELPAEVGEAAR